MKFFTRIDRYIMAKFLGTYFLAIALIISIAVVFDISEKMDNFFEHNAPLNAIVFDYYLNFIPYFANLFSPLFVFIAVIFFTSKMAENTEIIAILASGVSFKRMMFPYFVSALLIASLTFYLNGYVIPEDNITRLKFENQYVKVRDASYARNIQMELEPGVVAYLERFEKKTNMGYSFSLEKFNGKTLVSRLTAQHIKYDSLNHWKISNYIIRNFNEKSEEMFRGTEKDTIIAMEPSDFFVTKNMQEQMTNPELKHYIDKQKKRGIGNLKEFELEYHKRFASPFAAFILTLIGVSLSSEKKRGGIGLNIGVGLTLSFSYILFTTISSTFAIQSSMSPFLAVWLPNLTFIPIAFFLYRNTPKSAAISCQISLPVSLISPE